MKDSQCYSQFLPAGVRCSSHLTYDEIFLPFSLFIGTGLSNSLDRYFSWDAGC